MSKICKKLNFSTKSVSLHDDENGLDVKTLLMYEGKFEDANGYWIDVSAPMLRSMANNYDKYLSKPKPGESIIKKVYGVELNRPYKNVSMNHCKDDVSAIVGKVMGLSIEEDNGQTFLFGQLSIRKPEAVESVKKGLWTEVSISFDYDEFNDAGTLTEISYVFEGAIPGNRTFSKAPNQLVDLEFAKEVRTNIDTLRLEKKSVQKRLNMARAKREAFKSFDMMVKEGTISKADYKRICIDVDSINLMSYDPLVRIVKSVAMSRKNLRGQVSNNLQMSAMSSFMDHIIESGGKMEKGMSTEDMVAKIKAHMSGAPEIEPLNFNKAEMNSSGSLLGNLLPENTVAISSCDADRMMSLAHAAGQSELLGFMETAYGKKFEKAPDEDKEMSAESSEDKEDKKEDEEDFAKRKKEDRDYSKNIEVLDNKILDLSKNLSTLETSMNRLVDVLTSGQK